LATLDSLFPTKSHALLWNLYCLLYGLVGDRQAEQLKLGSGRPTGFLELYENQQCGFFPHFSWLPICGLVSKLEIWADFI